MNNSEVLISIKDIKKQYLKNNVLNGITFDIHKKEKIAILGANGSGKTTLIEIISQSKNPNSGEIIYNLKTKNPKFQIGVQFQEGKWPPGLSSYDVLKFYKKIYFNVTDEHINSLVNAFHLTEFYKKPLNKLSGGQKQRFNALLAVLHNPQIIILDEISNGLDLQLKHEIMKFLKHYLKENENSLLIVSHSPGEVEALCDRLIIIDNGICFFDSSIKNVIEKYNSVEKLMNIYFEGKLNSNHEENK